MKYQLINCPKCEITTYCIQKEECYMCTFCKAKIELFKDKQGRLNRRLR
jgi:ribosomal protein L37E